MNINPRQRTYLFAVVILGTAVALWGFKGIIQLLPGPDPK